MPKLRLHCPACGFNSLADAPLLKRRSLRVTCPRCAQRFPLHEGLIRRLSWPQRLQRLLGWLLLPVAYLALLLMLVLLTLLSVVLVPLALVLMRFSPEAAKGAVDFTPGELLLFTFWPPLVLLLCSFPLFCLYHLAWSAQPLTLLPSLSVLAGLTPNQLALAHIVLAAVSIALLLFYLARMVPGKLAQLRELQLMVPAKARSVTMGLVELEGVLRIEPSAGGEGTERWTLEDDSGRIPLAPKRRGGMPLPLFNDSLYHLDEGLADGDYVYLLGHVHPNPAATPATLDSERLLVRPERTALFPDPLWRQLFRRQRSLGENPGVFVLTAGGEGRAQTLLRRQLVVNAALSLVTIAAAVWMLFAEVPRLHGYGGWVAAEVAAAPEAVLLGMIASGDAAAQQRAAPVFFARWPESGEKDPQRPEWVAPTLQLLRHPDVATRQLALRAAGTLHSAADQVAPALLAMTRLPQADLRAGAARALGRLQAQPPESVAVLTALLQGDAEATVRDAACLALAGFDQADALSSACLRERLPAAGGEGSRELARALALVTGDPQRIVPLLSGFLADPDAQVRLAGADGLRAHGPAAAAAVPQILAVLPDEPDGAVEYRLLQAAREIGPAAAPLVPSLLREFRALKPPHVRRDTILSVLRGIGPAAIAAHADMLALLDAPAIPEDEVRAALVVLDALGTAAAAAVPPAQRLAESAREAETRRTAQWFLTRQAAAPARAGTATPP